MQKIFQKKFFIFVTIMFVLSSIVFYYKMNKTDKKDIDNEISFADSFDKKIVYFDLKAFENSLPSSIEKYDYMQVAFAIQGLVNRNKPILYYKYESSGFTFNGKITDEAWLDELQKEGNLLYGYTIEKYNSFYDILKFAKNLGVINGVVLWDSKVSATSDVSTTIAGVENLIPLRFDTSSKSCYTDLIVNRKLFTVKKSLVNKFRNINYLPDGNLNKMTSGIKSSGSSKNDAYLWAKKYYLDTKKTNSTLMGYSRDSWICGEEVCFIDSYLPNSLKPNEEREVSITLFNNSSETWTRDNFYRLAVVDDNDFKITWSQYQLEQENDIKRTRLYIDGASPVEPGGRITIKFKIKAPSTNGTYHLKLGFVHELVRWFDCSFSYEIKVSSTSLPNIYGSVAYKYGIFHSGLATSDYLIKNKAFVFDLSPDESIAPIDDRSQVVGTDVKTLKALLNQQSINNNKKTFTVVGFVPWFIKYSNSSDPKSQIDAPLAEKKQIEIISTYGGQTDADAAMPVGLSNASIFSHDKLNNSYKQNNDKNAIMAGKVVKEVYDPNTYYYTIYMGDYDCGAWTSGVLPYNFTYNSGVKDKYPLAWPIGTGLSSRVPQAFNWLYKNQRSNDYFVAGDNGTGYLNPTVVNNITTWRDYNISMNKKFDIDITGFLLLSNYKITDTIKNEYSKISPTLVSVFTSGFTATKYNNTPFIPFYIGTASRDNKGETIGESIYRIIKQNDQHFSFIRTLQVSREQAYAAIDKVYALAKQENKSVKVVDPYTMAYLYNNHPTEYKGCYTNGSNYQWIEGKSIPKNYSYVSTIDSKDKCTNKIKGDIDNSGTVNFRDYILIRKHILGMITLDNNQIAIGDMDGNNEINVMDYILIRNTLLGRYNK